MITNGFPSSNNIEYLGGENVNLNDIFIMGRNLSFKEKMRQFSAILKSFNNSNSNFYRRKILTPAGPEVIVEETLTGEPRKMIMFGSNNYLDLANHPFIIEKVRKAITNYGLGIGGPPLLNGHTKLHHELEEKLADLKHAESAMLFSSGYNANVGLISGLLTTKKDLAIYDLYSHASFMDGLKMSRSESIRFSHNDIFELTNILEKLPLEKYNNKFIGIEGVYSMDGDLADLPNIVKVARDHGSTIILDDAHGTLILGKKGNGTAEHFGVENEIDITMGTFSKAFSVTGGFVTASRDTIDYLRFFARSYMFSASLPIPNVAAVLAGLELTQKDSSHRENLLDNASYATKQLRPYGLVTEPKAAIITLKVPNGVDIRKASALFHEKGIFINSIEYPAVPLSEQRFRISIMASHTKEHIDKLVDAVDCVWRNMRNATI